MYGMVAKMPVIATASASGRLPKSAVHKIGCGDVTVLLRNRPELWEDDEDEGIDNYGVRERKEANRTRAKDECGYGDESVRRVEVAAQEEPGDECAEPATGEPPFVDKVKIAAPPVACNKA